MIRGTTPIHRFTLPFCAQNAKRIRLIYAQNGKTLFVKEKDDLEINGRYISIALTQQETFLFAHEYQVEIQLRVLFEDGTVACSSIVMVSVERCLDTEVLT